VAVGERFVGELARDGPRVERRRADEQLDLAGGRERDPMGRAGEDLGDLVDGPRPRTVLGVLAAGGHCRGRPLAVGATDDPEVR